MEENEKPHFAAIIEILQKIDPWLQRIDPGAADAAIGARSPLAADDRVTDPYQTSHAAWHSISHAVDHLHMLRTVLRDAGVIHMYAPFSLIRAALENAAAAVWLLAPASRTQRVLRRCRFAVLDINASESAAALVPTSNTRKPVGERLDRLRKIAQRAGVDEGEAMKRVGYGEIVKAAGGPTPLGAEICEFVWRMCSGIAHGDFWTTVSVATKVELPGAPAGIAHLQVTANVEAFRFATLVAAETTAQAWRLYDQRSRNPY